VLVAVTGASGFIGKRLVKALVGEGHKVRILSRRNLCMENVECFCGDLINPEIQLDTFLDGVDILFHCAGEIVNKSQMESIHVDGTRRLVLAAQGRIGRWVQLSSVGAYGYCREGVVTETSPEVPLGTYETTKTQSDEIVRNSGLPYVILRPSNVFGPTMTNQSLFQLVEMIRRGLFFLIGNKRALANYVHVDDVVNALIKCGFHPNATGNVFNLSQSIRVNQMAQAILDGLEIDKPLYRLPEVPLRIMSFLFSWIKGFPLTSSRIDALTSECQYESKKIMKELDFDYRFSLEERLIQFVKGM